MRYIDLDVLEADLKRQLDRNNPNWSFARENACYDLLEYLAKFPVIDPVRRGHWIKKRRRLGDIHYETGYVDFDGGVGVGEPITIKVDDRCEYVELYCSECGAVCSDSWNNFCGKCGADMRGEINETD